MKLRVLELFGDLKIKVSDDGDIYTLCHKDYEKLLKPKIDKYGYKNVVLTKNGKRKTYLVHRLVGQAFIPNPNNYPQIDHIDGNRLNNKVNNLEWVTAKENMNEAVRIGLFDNVKKIQRENAIKNNLSKNHIYGNEATKKKINQLDKQNNIINTYESISEASRKTGIHIQSISYSANGNRKTGGGFIWHFV